MSDDLVERVARALEVTADGFAMAYPVSADEVYRRLAVAAIDVMRGATDDGLRARVEAVLRDYDLAQPAARDRLRAALENPR